MMKLVVFLLFASAVLAQSFVDLPISEDSYLEEADPTAVHGLDPIGSVFKDTAVTGKKLNLVFKCDISSLAGVNSVDNAYFFYKQYGRSSTELNGTPYLKFDLWRIVTSWNETTVSYATSPAVVGTSAILTNYQDMNVNAVTGTITSTLASAKTAGDQQIAFLVTSSFPYVNVYMKDFQSTPTFRPYIRVYFS
jgi:hypothetical protein